ncbi:MAG: pyridoxal phosphate-dependent decarboxylase family protein, partial [Actinomycetota bacterium]
MLPLDPAPGDMRAMGEAALDYLIGFIHGLDDAPAEATDGAPEVARELRAAPPERGGDFDRLFDDAQRAIAATYEFAGPGYLAYIPGGGLYTAALADFIAQGVNRYVGLWQPSPAAVQIEENVVRWLCDVFDYPAGSQGLLLSGGSMANLSAMVTARHAKLGEDFLDGTYYVSEQAHASVTKAATIAGFSRRNLRLVPTDAELRMDPEALRALVREDRTAGLRPFLVAPSAGTTNTGAIDPLDEIADIVAGEDLWM